jgi:hypothetical protein
MAEVLREIPTQAEAPAPEAEPKKYRTARSAELGGLAIGVVTTKREGKIAFDREIVRVTAEGEGEIADDDEANQLRERLNNGEPIKDHNPQVWRDYMDALMDEEF